MSITHTKFERKSQSFRDVARARYVRFRSIAGARLLNGVLELGFAACSSCGSASVRAMCGTRASACDAPIWLAARGSLDAAVYSAAGVGRLQGRAARVCVLALALHVGDCVRA
eukprot:1428430-Prymnesium_polylepis.1